jgi:microcystin-dependent protein
VTNPQTVNVGIIVPLTGADVDTWGQNDVNPNMVAIDGYLGGVQPIAVTGAAPVILTSPAGFTATPTPGPTQAQNRVLRFTGVLAANQIVTLPLPGVYVIENLTTGNFVLSFQGSVATEVVAINQGERHTVYNDGANVRFVDLGGSIGSLEKWAGLSNMPAWVGACTKKPYLLCDGSIYNFSDFPYLGNRLLGSFGGNGITTFGVPDLRGRLDIPYDGTGSRITTAGSGLNGQSLGAVLDKQSNTLVVANLPPYTPSGTITNGAITFPSTITTSAATGAGGGVTTGPSQTNTDMTGVFRLQQAASVFNGAAQGGLSQPITNVQPSQITGIAVIRAG